MCGVHSSLVLKTDQMSTVNAKMKHVSALADVSSLFLSSRLWKAIYQLFMETLVLIYAYTNFPARCYLRPHLQPQLCYCLREVHRVSKLSVHLKQTFLHCATLNDCERRKYFNYAFEILELLTLDTYFLH